MSVLTCHGRGIRRFVFWGVVVACASGPPTTLSADEGPATSKPPRKASVKEPADPQAKPKPADATKPVVKQGSKPASTAGEQPKETKPLPNEELAWEFARTHHAELAKLLEQLRKNAPKEYRAAVADLDRARQKLDKTKARSAERYEAELAEWKLDSRIRLMVARLAMGGNPELETELRSAIGERLALRARLLSDEIATLERRLEKLREQQTSAQQSRDEAITRELDRLRKSATTAAAKAKEPRPEKPAATPSDAVSASPADTKTP
jgi:hypothetical protein